MTVDMALGALAVLGSGSAEAHAPSAAGCQWPLATPPPAKEVFAFCPGTEWQSYNWTTMTTVAAYSSFYTLDWEALICHAHQHGVRVVYATGACPSLDAATPEGARCPADISSPEAQDIYSRYWVNRTNAEGLDGLNLDIEGGIMPEHRDDLTQTVRAA